MIWVVTIHSCKALDGSKKSDPYVEAMCGEHTSKTPVKKNAGVDPVFMCQLELPCVPGEELRFVVKDKSMLKDSIMGTGAIHEAALTDGSFDGEIVLTTKKGVDGGRLRVSAMRR